MNRFTKFFTILLALAVLFVAACGDSTESPKNNDNSGTDVGDVSEGDVSENDVSEGDVSEGDVFEGDVSENDIDELPLGPPSVLFTRPIDDAVGVSTNVSVEVTFDRAMDPATLTVTSFVLKNGAVIVPATVDYEGTTVTLKPVLPLDNGTTYTATVTTDVTDLAGEALENNKIWSFETMLQSVKGPAAVDLGTAGDYVILSKAGISTTGTTAIVGDIAVSPASATYITGFSLLDPPTTHSESPLVTGKVWAADYDPPTPTKLTVAVLDMEGAYTDAAGRTLPDFTELGAGSIEKMTLEPGLYQWSSGVEFVSGVTLNGGANDVWIFQIAQDLLVGNGAIVTLTGGAQAKNVFWQVAGQVTLGTTASFQGIILTKTMLEMKTGAVLLGRALAQTAVTLDAAAVTQP